MVFRWLKRQKWQRRLQGCHFDIARSLLATQFQENYIRTDFANRLDQFLADPCFETAADLLEIEPELLSYFDASKSGNQMNLLFKQGFGGGKRSGN